MKQIILAAMFAAAGTFAMPAAQAASITIDTGRVHIGHDRDRYHSRRHDFDGDHWRRDHHRRHHRDCYTKTVRKWHNHRRVVERIRVCN